MNRVLHSSSSYAFILSELDQRINTFHLDPYASQLNVAYLATSGTYLSNHPPDLVKTKSKVWHASAKFQLKS